MQLQKADKVFNLPRSQGIHPRHLFCQNQRTDPWDLGAIGGPKGMVLRRDYRHRESGELEGRLVRKWETDLPNGGQCYKRPLRQSKSSQKGEARNSRGKFITTSQEENEPIGLSYSFSMESDQE